MKPRASEDRKGLIAEIFVLLCVLYVPSMLAQLLVSSPARLGHWTTEAMLRRTLAEGAYVLLILYIVLRANSQFARPSLAIDLRLDVATGILLYCFGWTIYILIQSISAGRPYTLAMHFRSWDSPAFTMVLAAVTTAVSGLYQELLMRWYLITRFEQVGIGTWTAMIVTSILFGCWHFYEGHLGFVTTFATGLLYGAFYAKFRRLWPLVIAHFLWNFLIVLQHGHP